MIAASWALIPRRLPRPPPQRTCRAAEPGNFSVPRNPVVVSLAAEDTTMKKLLMLAALAAAACTRGNDSVTLSARLAAANGQALPTANGAAEVASGINVTGVRIVIRHLRLEREDDKTETKVSEGPLLLDVSDTTDLGGKLLKLVTKNVPAGTYDKLKLDIQPVESAPTSRFQALVDRGASVLIEGWVDTSTNTFTFASALEAEVEYEARFQLSGSTSNITLNIDVSKWFTAADGSRLSPLDPDPKARDAILANIRGSFSAFEDDNEDGEEDEARDGGTDDGEHEDAGDDHGEHDGG